MEQVLHLLYLNHRNQLKYPENNMMVVPHPHKKVYQSPPRRVLEHEYGSIRKVGRSVDLGNRLDSKSQTPTPRKRKLSRDEIDTMKKYIKGYEAHGGNEEYLALPRITSRHRQTEPREPSGRKLTHHQAQLKVKQARQMQRPKLTSADKRRMAMRVRTKMKKWVNAIIFVNRLKKKLLRKVNNFNMMTELSQNLLQIINKMIVKHYCEVIDVPLMGFADNLKKKIEKPSSDLTSDVVNNLVDISEGLKKTSLRKDLLKFLTLVTLNHARVPHDFFTEFELLRLEFSDRRFELVQMVEMRVRMVIGIFLSIKMFCNYIINHPWDVPMFNVSRADAKKMEPVIWAYSSYFYYSTISFFQKMEAKNAGYLKILRSKGVEAVQIKEERDYFYDGVTLNYKKEAKQIHSNFAMWINRISSEVIKNRKNFRD